MRGERPAIAGLALLAGPALLVLYTLVWPLGHVTASKAGLATQNFSQASAYLRLNQAGYHPDDAKVAIAAAASVLNGDFTVARASDGATVFTGTIGPDQGAWGAFSHHHPLDFSTLTTTGTYRVRLPSGATSPTFAIGDAAYNGLADLSRRFFAVQRSGDTHPDGHAPSHLNDAPLSTDTNQHRDVTGGWYDAGDYLKFTLTTAYATLFQLLAYRDAPYAFQDLDTTGVPQVLNEAPIGLDWLEKMWNPNEPMLYVQVGSEADHNQGWRLPEDDTLDGTAQRPVYPADPGKGANLAGKTAAAFALAAQLYGEPATPVYDSAQANHYRALAEAIYAWGQSRPDSQPSVPSYFYDETTWQDDMALAAAELYRLTDDTTYRDQARNYAQAAGPAWWFSWGDLNGLAHAELARTDAGYVATAAGFLAQDLAGFQSSAAASPWGMASANNLVWGSLFPILGAALEARWYEELTGSIAYQPLARAQVDFVLGRNPWGATFLIGAGSTWPHDPHHQVAYLGLRPQGRELDGTWMGGPAAAWVFNSQGITLAEPDEYAAFQSSQAVYHDDRNDYVTNEPSVALNATGLLLTSDLASYCGLTGDVNRDARVTLPDVRGVAARWHQAAGQPYDQDGDDWISVVDVMRVAAVWGSVCEWQ